MWRARPARQNPAVVGLFATKEGVVHLVKLAEPAVLFP